MVAIIVLRIYWLELAIFDLILGFSPGLRSGSSVGVEAGGPVVKLPTELGASHLPIHCSLCFSRS